MNIAQLTAILARSGADGWELTWRETTAWEFYFIRHQLDQHRVRAVTHPRVKVYRRFGEGKYLGSASGEIPPTATEKEAEDAVRRYLTNAAAVQNSAYTLNHPTQNAPAPKAEPCDLSALSEAFIRALASLPETDTEDVNSYEIVVQLDSVRFLNSEGIDVSYTAPASQCEVVINARRDGREIELYRMFTGGACDEALLRERLTDAFRIGRDRLIAQPTPALGAVDALFSVDAALEIYNYFAARVDAGFKARGYSDWEAGKPVCAEGEGDRVSLAAVPTLPGSSNNAPFDPEGAPRSARTLIEDGVVRALLGNRQFASMLGLKDAFIPGNLVFSGGTQDEAELRTGAYLEIAECSDFQVDPITGNLMGEIRLGYWHDGARCAPVTGGSVSGSLAAMLPTMRMSRATRAIDTRVIPALTRLQGVQVAGRN